MVFVLLRQSVWSRRHRLIWMLAAFMLARLQMREIVFAGRRGVNKYMEDEARREGLLRRMPVAEIGWDDHNLSEADIKSLSMISTAADKLDWYRAKAAWDSSSRLKTPLCNAMMHAAFRCGRYADGQRIFWDMSERGLPKNSITYNCAIRLFSMLGQYEHAYALFEEARDTIAVSGDPRLVYLLLSEMINSMAEAGNLTGVGEFLQLMTDKGFQIGEVTWGSALKACMIAGAPAVADFFMEQMAQSNISATVIHYKLVMGAYAGRKAERILALAEEAKLHGCDKDTYFLEVQVAALLGFCAREKRVQSETAARTVVQQASPQHREAALATIREGKSRGVSLSLLTRYFQSALLEDLQKQSSRIGS